MKIRIVQTEQDIIVGQDYLNLCLIPPKEETEHTKQLNPNFVFDEYACDFEVEEIQLIDVIEFIPAEFLIPTLEYFIRKIKKGGSLIIVGVDATQLCKQFSQKQIELEEFNFLIYGTTPKKQSIMVLDRLVSYLGKQNFKVLKKDLNTIYYTIVAIKE